QLSQTGNLHWKSSLSLILDQVTALGGWVTQPHPRGESNTPVSHHLISTSERATVRLLYPLLPV
ncbi:unnamed protein product, partial [Gulo gulo]